MGAARRGSVQAIAFQDGAEREISGRPSRAGFQTGVGFWMKKGRGRRSRARSGFDLQGSSSLRLDFRENRSTQARGVSDIALTPCTHSTGSTRPPDACTRPAFSLADTRCGAVQNPPPCGGFATIPSRSSENRPSKNAPNAWSHESVIHRPRFSG